MADQKLTALAENITPTSTDLLYLVDDPAGVPVSEKIEINRLLAWLGLDVVQGRLTLTTGTPVTTGDVTAATTLYFTPFNGDRIAIYDGTSWDLYSFTERSIAVPNQATQMYDVFIYDNAGVLTLELTAWTNDTTRATALTTQDGIYVRSGATTRRYLGSFRTTTSAGQTEDSESKRFVWNYNNRVSRQMAVVDTANTWTYAVSAWRAANNSNANRVEAVIGISESPVTAMASCRMNVQAGQNGTIGIGIDSVAANSAQIFHDLSTASVDANSVFTQAIYVGVLSVGYHYIQWLEYRRTGTLTYYGNAGIPGFSQSGLLAMTEG